MVELKERGAYRGYGTLPANPRRSPRGGPMTSMCSSPGTSYHRIKYAHQWGPVLRGRLRQGRTRSQGGGNPRWGRGGGSRLGPRSPQAVGALTQARGRPQRGKHCSSRPRRGERLGPQNPLAVGALLQTRGLQRGKHYSSRPRRGERLGSQNPLAVRALLQTRRPQEGEYCSRNHVTRRVQTAGIDPCLQGGNQLQLLPWR